MAEMKAKSYVGHGLKTVAEVEHVIKELKHEVEKHMAEVEKHMAEGNVQASQSILDKLDILLAETSNCRAALEEYAYALASEKHLSDENHNHFVLSIQYRVDIVIAEISNCRAPVEEYVSAYASPSNILSQKG